MVAFFGGCIAKAKMSSHTSPLQRLRRARALRKRSKAMKI